MVLHAVLCAHPPVFKVGRPPLFQGLYTIGVKFWHWLEAELHGKKEESFDDNKLLGSFEEMLVICGFCDCVLFINATVTKDFLQTGSLRTSLKEEADLGTEAGGKLR
eukprot:5514731-Pleurochrysis_carterae.AAC.2